LAWADLPHLAGLQMGQAHGQGGEVVDHQQRVEAHRAPRGLDGKPPGVVRHAHLVAFDRVGDGDRAQPDVARIDLGQVGPQGRQEIGVVRAPQVVAVAVDARFAFECEPGIGAADVGEQTGAMGEAMSG
jgi:hypothetical protein